MSTTRTFKATGLHCSSCSMLITMDLQDIDGVYAVECDHVTGETVVTFDEGKVDPAKIREAIVEAGYDAELVA